MTYSAKFSGWNSLTISDLIVAYRKAKADLFFENTFPTAVKFSEYEQNLLINLNALLEQLKDKKGFASDKKLLGECRLIPKKLGTVPKTKKQSPSGHIYFSEPNLSFDLLMSKDNIVPEFRIIGDFPVDAHIISALWINMVGHKFDACLDDIAYGARLRRVANDDILDKKASKPFHLTAIGSLVPYFQRYQKWRSDGLNAIRDELEKDKKVIATSLDLKSFYHLLDPSDISHDDFQYEIGLKDKSKLSTEEKQFTLELTNFLKEWSSKAQEFSTKVQVGTKNKVNGGLVIGLVATRIISNILLYQWDKLIREKVTPIHYGRYVDDMFLVLHDPGNIHSSDNLMCFLQSRLGKGTLYNGKGKNQTTWSINQGKVFQKKSKIQLQAEKQKLFILDGKAGCDLLDSIEKEITELSSEYRLMPSPDQLETSTAAKVLSAAGSVNEAADNLRRADGLTVRRLSWSLQLRHVETLARDLPAKVWKKERDEFYQFAHNHILRADNIFAHYVKYWLMVVHQVLKVFSELIEV
jgi:hypothetical protein